MAGLSLNLNKRRLFGVNIVYDFLQVASDFFACKIGTIQFFFLGLAVGSNHRRMSFLNPIVWKVRRRISV